MNFNIKEYKKFLTRNVPCQAGGAQWQTAC